MSESDDAYTVRASVPGVQPEDLEINVQNNILTIRGEMKNEQERQGERWHVRERRTGQFQRTVALPNNVDTNEVGAIYDNGVLTLTLPKSKESQPRRINVQQGSSQQGNNQQGSNRQGSRQHDGNQQHGSQHEGKQQDGKQQDGKQQDGKQQGSMQQGGSQQGSSQQPMEGQAKTGP
jgi:HSP20 family protein